MRYFAVMEVKLDDYSNGYIPVESPQGSNWISASRVIEEDQLREKLEKIKIADGVDLLEILIK